MKKILAAGVERIFQMTRAFRDGERGRLHSPEFAILEWYAAGATYEDLMTDTEELVFEAAGLIAAGGIVSPAERWGTALPPGHRRRGLPGACRLGALERFPGRSLFSRTCVDKVEPALARRGGLFLTDYPEPVGALARRKEDDPRLCERFELYLDGLEICNGFSELTDVGEQRARFERDNAERLRLGKEAYPVDTAFLAALEAGLPSCAGNALGIDRLLLALTGGERLSDVTLLAEKEFLP